MQDLHQSNSLVILIKLTAPYLLKDLKYPETAPVTALDIIPVNSKQYNSFIFLMNVRTYVQLFV